MGAGACDVWKRIRARDAHQSALSAWKQYSAGASQHTQTHTHTQYVRIRNATKHKSEAFIKFSSVQKFPVPFSFNAINLHLHSIAFALNRCLLLCFVALLLRTYRVYVCMSMCVCVVHQFPNIYLWAGMKSKKLKWYGLR